VESLDLVDGADGSPHWTRVWPSPEDNSRHAELELWMATSLELWMATSGHRIVSRPVNDFDWCGGGSDSGSM
jgi:predicted alpha/beta hydrolase family esterase